MFKWIKLLFTTVFIAKSPDMKSELKALKNEELEQLLDSGVTLGHQYSVGAQESEPKVFLTSGEWSWQIPDVYYGQEEIRIPLKAVPEALLAHWIRSNRNNSQPEAPTLQTSGHKTDSRLGKRLYAVPGQGIVEEAQTHQTGTETSEGQSATDTWQPLLERLKHGRDIQTKRHLDSLSE